MEWGPAGHISLASFFWRGAVHLILISPGFLVLIFSGFFVSKGLQEVRNE
jgi:hypothetical protein